MYQPFFRRLIRAFHFCRRIILDNLVGHVVDNQRATADINQRFHQNLELSALFMFSLPVRASFSSLISISET